MDQIVMLKDVKMRAFSYFTFVLTSLSSNVSAV